MRLLIAFIIGVGAISAAPITQVTLLNPGNPVITVPNLTIDGVTDSPAYVGPYTLLINGSDVAALCIDFFDQSGNDTWNAYVTQVGSSDLSGTYHPSYGQEYEEEAYIYSQIVQPGADRTGLQEAAWDITAYGITNSSYTALIGDNSYIDAALANYNKMDLSGYAIVSDTTPFGEQELLIAGVAAPEPGSLALFGLVLLIGGAAARRSSRKPAEV